MNLKNKNCFKLILFTLLLLGFLLLNNSIGQATTSPDAIGLRVMPNNEHYSAYRWYNEQGFDGSPQSITVDGYEAVRDGRTVYVNAANVSTTGDLYTNIYIISYNQSAESATTDIFGQILSHWKFNTNLTEPGMCSQSSDVVCLTNDNCPINEYCLSQKAKTIRDTRRLSDMVEINRALENYKAIHGYYPKLESGSYLPNKTLSTWPSWQDNLATELGIVLPVDPINKLGTCDDYDETTCWNSEIKEFAGSIPDNLPENSQAYVFDVSSDGSSYSGCSVMESGYFDTSQNNVCAQSTIEYFEQIENHPPIIQLPTSGLRAGYAVINLVAGQKLEYFLSAFDPDNDDLSPISLWEINAGNLNNWIDSQWSSVPERQNTEVSNIKKIYVQSVGQAGEYYFSVTVNDGRGGIDNINFRVVVTNQPPVIEVNSASVVAGHNDFVVNPFTIRATDYDNHYPLTFNILGQLPQGLSGQKIDDNTFQIDGIPVGSYPQDTDYQLNISVTDNYGASSEEDFTITVVNNPPIFTTTPVTEVRVGNYYSYDVEATDSQDNHLITQYRFGDRRISDLNIDSSTGLVDGIASVPIGRYEIDLEAIDQYDAVGRQNYELWVKTYCGDGLQQNPNDEGDEEVCEDGNTENIDACSDTCQWTCKAMDIDFNNGRGDGVVYDDDNNSSHVEDVNEGEYLKLLGVMPTPYIWIANSGIEKVAKLRTFDGPKRDCKRNTDGTVDCWWVDGTWEKMGQLIGTYNVGSNPSRTAVNVETGDIWIANRNSGNVTKLDINGVHLKTCATGSGPRGVAIEKNGDVWVGNYSGGGVVKISGDDTHCEILKTINVGSYGLAIDSNGNIWSSHGTNGATKIDVNNNFTTTHYPAGGGYGITIDLDDNVWLGGYNGGHGAIRLNSSTGGVNYFGTGYNGLGITVDLNNNIWPSTYTNNGILKISPGNHPAGLDYVFRINSGGSDAHGACGDSQGNIWVVNNSSGTIRVLDSGGNILGANSTVSNATIGTDGLRVFKAYEDGAPSTTYSYSDMTGLNRALLLRSGVWEDTFDSGFVNQHWGDISWEAIMTSEKQSIEIFVRASNDSNLNNFNWVTTQTWNSLEYNDDIRKGRYAQIKIKMRSSEKGITPVLWGLKMNCD